MNVRNSLIGIGVLGVTSLSAVAGSMSASVIVLNPDAEGALVMSGNGTLRSEASGVQVNSTHEHAVVASGNGLIVAPNLNVVGGVEFDGNASCTGLVVLDVDPIDDPFREMVVPSPGDALGELSLKGGLHGVEPGYYDGGISISGKASVQLHSGVYYVGGTGLKLTAGSIVGDGVTIVVLSGDVEVSAQATVNLSPPNSGPTAGVTIFQPATNTEDIKLTGGSGLSIAGGICAPGARVVLAGTSSLDGAITGSLFGELIVADRVRLTGNGLIRVGTPTETVRLPASKLLYD